jgi:nucleolar GTP-binding protein
MSFSEITKIEKYSFYLDTALTKAKKDSLQYKSTLKDRDYLSKVKRVEERRINVVSSALSKPLQRIISEFPSFDNLTEFYKELIKIETGILELKKALATLKWTDDKIQDFSRFYIRKILYSKDMKGIQDAKREYLGRISSLFRKNKEIFTYLDECRTVFERFPTVKDGLYTVAISGFPNVGKSTLLSKLTLSKPKIDNYAFTTKTLLTGYDCTANHKVQYIDTPGALNRLSENHIERMAYCAIKYACDTVIFVFDPVQYTFETQENLLKRLNDYGKDIIVYISKKDICSEEIILLKEKLEKIRRSHSIKEIFDDKDDVLKYMQDKAKAFFR